MKTKYIVYNPNAGFNNIDERIERVKAFFTDDKIELCDITKIKNSVDFLKAVPQGDDVIVCGGDGTISRFVNDIYGTELKNNIYYYAAGNGNDFWHDLGMNEDSEPVLINEYIKNLPTVTVNGKDYHFINAVGYGIDGYCCEVGEKLRKQGKRPNYTSIAIKGLLHGYTPTSAKVTVDGKTKKYKKVWIAPTMYGKFYGGGMIPAPEQSRNDENGCVSFATMHGSGKLHTLMIFPKIFDGTYIKHKKNVDTIKGHNITVEFDRPTTLQIDGEIILNVSKYEVSYGCGISQEKELKKALLN